MIKKKKDDELVEYKPDPEYDGNGKDADVIQLMKQMLKEQQDLHSRMDDIESNKARHDNTALNNLIEHTYNTPVGKYHELTNLPLPAVKIHAIGMAQANIDKPEFKDWEFSELVRFYWFGGLRSVKGTHLGRAIHLAEEQLQAAKEDEDGGMKFGGE